MKAVYILMISTIFFLCCNEQVNEPASHTPYEQWFSYGIHDYTIEQTRYCFCPEGGEKMKVIVRSDTVYSVIKISDLSVLQSPADRHYITIDSLFGIIRYSKSDSIVVTYDSHHGYPGKLDINPQLHPVDGGVMYETSNLHVIK